LYKFGLLAVFVVNCESQRGEILVMRVPVFFRLVQPGEEDQVYELVLLAFDAFVAPDFPPEGVQEFLKYARPEALRQRWSGSEHFALLATQGEQVVGMIEIRNHDHVSMFFVAPAHMGQGIGRALWGRALANCRRERPDLRPDQRQLLALRAAHLREAWLPPDRAGEGGEWDSVCADGG